MNLLSSLRSRIFLTSGLLAMVAIGTAIYLVSRTITREAENALEREIAATLAVVNELRTQRAQTFTAMARLIADTPKLKAAVDTNDPPTVQDTANDYQRQLNSNLLLVTNRMGEVLATVGLSRTAALAVASQAAVRNALDGRESFSVLPQPDGVLQLVTTPILIGLENPDILGTLSVGFLLDDALATQLKAITGSEIAFGMNGEILATTLPAAERPTLAALLQRSAPQDGITLGAIEYVARTLPLSAGPVAGALAEGPMAIVLRSRTEQLRVLRGLYTELTVTAVVAAIVAMLLSFGVARTITRPLAAITDVMREVAATGDLTRKIVLRGGRRWDDEDARLLAATFNTLTDSIARFQREISQKERLSSLGRLSTVIAHEVRNPLMIIKAALHTVRQPGVSVEALREAAVDIDEEVGRLNRIVNDVLDFARPIRFELATADLNALCRESASAAQAAPGVAVTVDLDPSMPLTTTDAERLRLALVNLIVNARQSVEDRGADGQARNRPAVLVTTRVVDGRARIVVADAGGGIGTADLSRVFDPYFTTKRGGTGLGLPIAKNIIEGLGGTLTVTSVGGRGTDILVELPLDRPVGPAAVVTTAGRHTSEDAAPAPLAVPR